MDIFQFKYFLQTNQKIHSLILLGQWRLESNLNFAPGWWTQSIEQQEGDSSETSNRLCLHSANDRCHPFRSQVRNNNTTCYGSCRGKTWRNKYTLAVCLWYSRSRFILETSVCYLHPHFLGQRTIPSDESRQCEVQDFGWLESSLWSTGLPASLLANVLPHYTCPAHMPGCWECEAFCTEIKNHTLGLHPNTHFFQKPNGTECHVFDK